MVRIAPLMLAVLAVHPGEPVPAKLRLADLVGEWVGRGTFLGMPASASFRWEPVLGGAFLRLEVRIRPEGAGSPPFEGNGYYRAAGDSVAGGSWLDSEGNSYALGTLLESDSLTTAWGSGTPPRGQSVYRLRSDGALEVVDRVRGRSGDLRELNRFEVRRR